MFVYLIYLNIYLFYLTFLMLEKIENLLIYMLSVLLHYYSSESCVVSGFFIWFEIREREKKKSESKICKTISFYLFTI